MPQNRLLVEGVDDEHVFKNLCDAFGIKGLDIRRAGSYSELVRLFPVKLKESDTNSLGIVVDADANATGRWETFKSILSRAGYFDLPASPAAAGTIVGAPAESILPRTGIWIMPDNASAGAIEAFIQSLIPSGDASLAHARKVIAELPDACRKFKPTDEQKATIHTWLAWQSAPGRPFGIAIKAKFLDVKSAPAAVELAEWLRDLCRLSEVGTKEYSADGSEGADAAR